MKLTLNEEPLTQKRLQPWRPSIKVLVIRATSTHDSSVLGLDFPNRGFVVFDRQLEEQGKNKSVSVSVSVSVCVSFGEWRRYFVCEMREKGISIKMKGSGEGGRWRRVEFYVFIYMNEYE
uniref:Uncharacterized protein n=1 Tax=Opuntia streptacantha TaxID=393608 RepID=A0A7C8ZY83_OPUST